MQSLLVRTNFMQRGDVLECQREPIQTKPKEVKPVKAAEAAPAVEIEPVQEIDFPVVEPTNP